MTMQPAPKIPSRFERLSLVAIVLVAVSFYFWSAGLGSGPWATSSPNGYYNLQTEGFRTGHLYAAVQPDPGLLLLDDPYDPVANAPFRMHDMTFWKGHYYLYFGAAPILLAFLPFRVLTGHYISEPAVVACFVSVGLTMAVLLLVNLRRRWFAEAPAPLVLAVVAAVALGSPVIYLVQAPQFYQVPISCAYALMMGGLYFVGGLMAGKRSDSLRSLAFGGSCFGLCLAARPNYLLAMPLLSIPVAWWVLDQKKNPRDPGSWVRPALAAFLPVCVIGLLVMVYNWLRFGNPAEFGMRYQLAGQSFVNFQPLALHYLAPHLWEYLWRKVSWLPYFPFLESPVNGPFGVLHYLPFLWLALAALWPSRGNGTPADPAPRFFGWLLLGCALANLLMDSLFFFLPELRYVSDFAPLLIVAAGVGAFRLSQLRTAFGSAVGIALAILTVGMVLGVYVEHLPSDYRASGLARVSNRLAPVLDRLAGRKYGGIRLRVELPPATQEGSEPLFQTGNAADRRDWLEIHYLERGRAQLGYFHAGIGETLGCVFDVPPSRILSVEVLSSALLPPATHPLFAGWSDGEMELAERTLVIRANGNQVLSVALPAYPSTPSDLIFGRTGIGGATEEVFKGKILRVERMDVGRVTPAVSQWERLKGPLAVTLQFPVVPGSFEPIVANGRGTSSQLLYAIYGPNRTVQLALDTAGQPPLKSRFVGYDPAIPTVLTVWFGAWAPDGPESRRFVLKYGDDVLFDEEHHFNPGADSATVVGKNSVGSGAAGPRFTGLVTEVKEEAIQTLPVPRSSRGHRP